MATNSKRLQELGHRLTEAMNASPEVKDAVRRIQLEGFQVAVTMTSARAKRERLEVTIDPPAELPPEPTFRLDGDDVEFLKSMRIDPTRAVRRRR